MSSDHQVHNIHIETPSESQQSDGSNGGGKMMTQAEYLKYKQGDSNANNYYGFSRTVDSKPVAWVNGCKFVSFSSTF